MKIIKRLLLVILCVTLLVCSCSCDLIDELRGKTLYHLEDGNIKYGDYIYVKADINTKSVIEVNTEDYLVTCAVGEPLLWAHYMDEWGTRWSMSRVNKERTVIDSDFSLYNDDYDSDEYNGFYFREDKYDELLEEFERFDKGEYIIAYNDYRVENGEIVFSKEDSAALAKTFEQASVSLNELENYEFNDWGNFYKYSTGGSFSEFTELSFAEIDGKFYLTDAKYAQGFLATGRAEEILKDLMEKITAYEEYEFSEDYTYLEK